MIALFSVRKIIKSNFGGKMLKDIFKNITAKNNKNSLEDKINKSILDGEVEIWGYKHDDKGNKTLIYHNVGDNTVTNWMRHAIMMLLSGYAFGAYGSTRTGTDYKINISKPVIDDHTSTENHDGYCINGEQYLWEEPTLENTRYPIDINERLFTGEDKYALFPTKILLGTGCEYVSWEELEHENKETNAAWYNNMVSQFSNGSGNEETARENFNVLVNSETEYGSYNNFSGTFGSQGNYVGGSMLSAVTVNDPDTTVNILSTSDLAKRCSVVGAVKTLNLPGVIENSLESTVSDSGRMVKGSLRGAGKPCFIYLKRNEATEDGMDWAKQTSDIYISRDLNNSDYLNRITFKIELPAQTSGNSNAGKYYPFNGYTFKQIGLYNDALLDTGDGENTYMNSMPCGMLLAVKNIQSFTKTADTSIVFTWTLTI